MLKIIETCHFSGIFWISGKANMQQWDIFWLFRCWFNVLKDKWNNFSLSGIKQAHRWPIQVKALYEGAAFIQSWEPGFHIGSDQSDPMDIVQISLIELHWEQFMSCCIVYFAKLSVYRPLLVVFSKSAEERSRGDCKILIWGWGWWGLSQKGSVFFRGISIFHIFFHVFARKLSLPHLVYVVSEQLFKYESMAWYQSWPAFLNLFLRKYNNIIII